MTYAADEGAKEPYFPAKYRSGFPMRGLRAFDQADHDGVIAAHLNLSGQAFDLSESVGYQRNVQDMSLCERRALGLFTPFAGKIEWQSRLGLAADRHGRTLF
jgi:hypothetical protein